MHDDVVGPVAVAGGGGGNNSGSGGNNPGSTATAMDDDSSHQQQQQVQPQLDLSNDDSELYGNPAKKLRKTMDDELMAE